MKSFLLIALFMILRSTLFAQIYPVQVTVVPTPPHRNYLNSFSEQGALNVYLTLTDFNSGPVAVKLSMKLNGPGYEFRSLPNNFVYVLNPGEPKQVPVEDLAVFFSSAGQTLNFNQSKLPEGNSSICVDVYKNQTGELLSNNGCGYFYMGYGQPAQLLQPTCNTTITIPEGFPATTDLNQTPLQFNFSPALAPIGLQNEVENTLYIYNWLGTVNTNPPLQPTGLSLAMDPIPLGPITSYTLLPIDNQLIVGQEYVWYVQSTLSGSTNQFQNTGWTVPCKFKYGTTQSIEATLAEGLSVEWVDLVSQSETKGQATWQVVKEDPNSSATFNQFILSYRKVVPEGEDPYEWFADTVNDVSKAIYQLEPETTYEAYVAGKLGSFISEPTATRTFTTGPPRTYACGVSNFGTKATAFQPLEYADPGMKVKIGMFQLEFVDVENTGQPGHFSGTGLIPIDFLFGMEARVEFDDLKIDKEYDVWEGTANVLTDGLDAWLQDQYQQFQDPIYVNGTIDSAYVSDSLAHVVINGIDTTFAFPCATCPVILNDVAGNQVTIYPNGTVVWGSYLDVSSDKLDITQGKQITFKSSGELEQFGTDVYQYLPLSEEYELIKGLDGTNYFVTNKSIGENVSDKVLAVLTDTLADLVQNGAVLKFLKNDQIELTFTQDQTDSRMYNLQIPGSAEDFQIYAYIDSSRFGKLNVYSYYEKSANVMLIPLVDTNDLQPGFRNEVAKIFNGANFKLNITMFPQWNDTVYTVSRAIIAPENEEVTLANKYSADMRNLRDAYLDAHPEVNVDGYVVFLVPGFNNPELQGYMVRGKSLGFVKATTSDFSRVLAHELGHGIGGLKHIWLQSGMSEGETNLLMDYSDGVNLTKADWKELRDSDFMSALFDDVENGEGTQGGKAFYYGIYVNIIGGDTTISHRRFLGQYEFYKNGPISNPYCKKADYICSVDKYFKWENGEWTPFWYDGLNKVKYLVERVDLSYNHVKYLNHYDTPWLATDPNSSGTKAESIYTVKKLMRPGESNAYAFKIYDAYLNEVCDYINDGSSTGVRTYYFNDLWLSNEFLEQYEKRQNKQITTCNLLSWLENHPMVYDLSEAALDNARDKFNLNTSDDHSIWLWGDGWGGKAIVHNYASAKNGISIHYVKTGPNGEWIRDVLYISNPNYANGSADIHKKYGYASCSHTLTIASQVNNYYHELEIPTDLQQFESIYNLLLSGERCKMYEIAPADKMKIFKRALNADVNDNDRAELCTALLKNTKKEDITKVINLLKGTVPGTNTTYLRNMYDHVRDADEFRVKAWMQTVIRKYRDYYAENATSYGNPAECLLTYTDEDKDLILGSLKINDVHIVGTNSIMLNFERLKRIETSTQMVACHECPYSETTEYDYIYYPEQNESFVFDEPILITYQGDLTSVNSVFSGSKFILAPAFFLDYIDEEEWENDVNTAMAVAEIVIDVALIPTGIGLIKNAYNASKYGLLALEVTGVLGSTLNIVQNVNCINSSNCPEKGLADAVFVAINTFQLTKMAVYTRNNGKILRATNALVSETKNASELKSYDDMMDVLTQEQRLSIIQKFEACATCQVAQDAEVIKIYQAAKRSVSGAGNNQLWTSIDEFDGLFNGKVVTYYDVNVTYQTGRVRAGIAFEENGILNFDINLPSNLQGQGVGTEIFTRAINDYSPSQVQGLWKSSDNYLGGESINLTIFKQKIADGMTEVQAAFETPTGKILKANGFGGTPIVLINTSSEVKIIFNP